MLAKAVIQFEKNSGRYGSLSAAVLFAAFMAGWRNAAPLGIENLDRVTYSCMSSRFPLVSRLSFMENHRLAGQAGRCLAHHTRLRRADVVMAEPDVSTDK
ncbi:uncharacterized protein K452DRAFT_92640 [Aplosporella prunicola CBS 121167]|uniref:Uncharacterized protein n=1 Tax=Aplosporella prunicola CBS 121167 TaxID=1176127 RepID=A0A6A6B513_9PEZI|nr:uncharacterized protein K452DRAFT_92640 [Aplosporella prunicola CBS 121167]KAF2138365.1 hypothetical protein K452DRAFT_92640 [Aplosporella prunicola CBS 121167]